VRTDEAIFQSFEANQFRWQYLILEVLLDIRRAVCKKPYVKPEIKSEPRRRT